MTSFEELMRELSYILPEANVEQDNHGQLVIYTNVVVVDGELRPFEDL